MNSRHLSFLLLAALCACDTTASLTKLRDTAPGGSAYGIALSGHYRNYAELLLTRYDWWSSKYFADKGLMITEGFEPPPEDPKDWNISKGELPELEKARTSLLEVVDDEAKRAKPELSAKAVASYDCWVESMDDGWQNPRIERCRDVLFETLTALTKERRTDTPGAAQDTPLISSSLVLYFPFDSSHLEGEFLKQMQSLIESLKANPNAQLVINGHADRAGTDAYNLALSARRAEYVKSLLTGTGIDPARIEYYAFGESDPAIETEDDVREPTNRRVEIFLE